MCLKGKPALRLWYEPSSVEAPTHSLSRAHRSFRSTMSKIQICDEKLL